MAANKMAADKMAANKDDGYADVLLQHDADGIQEYDNPSPPWLIYLFYATIVFAFGYLVLLRVQPGAVGTGSVPARKQGARSAVGGVLRGAPDRPSHH